MKDTQNFKGKDAYCCIKEAHKDMPMTNPKSLKMAMNNTFHGMPAYPTTYVFEGMTNEPMRPGDLRNREEKLP